MNDKYLQGLTLMLKLAVIIEPINSSAYTFWKYYYNITLVTMIVQCIIHFILAPFDLKTESVLIIHTAIYIGLYSRYILILFKVPKITKLIADINENFHHRTHNHPHTLTMDNAVAISDKLPIFWTISCINSALLLSILPVILEERGLPIPAWFPYNYKTTPAYVLTLIWQGLTQINLGILAGVTDMLLPCIVIIMRQQFRILADNFKSDTTIEGLKRNIRHHQTLLEICNQINDIFQELLVVKIGCAMFYIVFMAFTIVTVKSQILVGVVSYSILSMNELLVYTYSGQILTQNADFLWTLYECPWYLCEANYKRIFLLVIMRTSKVVHLKAGGYFLLTAPAFITFMKTISSYVALLRQLTDE